MSVSSTALFAVRVLTYQGRIDWASESDTDLVPHLHEISNRYEELKGTNDFRTAGLTAKSEWLARYLQANSPASQALRSNTLDTVIGIPNSEGGRE
jgi:hypothetical protein